MSGDWTWPDDVSFSWEDRRKREGVVEVGHVIEVRTSRGKKKVLVGDINALGGVCDDCTMFSEDDKILRWKKVTW